ncbi:Protein-methionine sulfoxide oxidase mical2b [Bagarius yarrelli]|uniref:Protein-methionine sulfoxide oxidase mical2b n=1 Tax=Bagarius yarrelli TaxID=175774 RepID=A0A556V0R6_BAGYA|nr:Protein-methionine sulfoxide oxidase mical2b [Bagarius yarrelli]
MQEDHIQTVPQDAESSAKPQLSDLPKFITNSRAEDFTLQYPAPESKPHDSASSQLNRALPFLLIKTFDQKLGGDDALIEDNGDSDFEEIHIPHRIVPHRKVTDKNLISPSILKPECQAESSSSPVEPEPSPPVSGFQLWASVLRKSFSGATNNPKVIIRNRPHRERPLSEGSFSLGSLIMDPDRDTMSFGADTEESQSVTPSRSEITTMLEQVTLGNKPPGASKDDIASLPTRKLNFFSSMRMKRNEGEVRSKTDNQTEDIWGILSKFRNKETLQQRDGDDYLSSEEDQDSIKQKSESRHLDRRRKRQEKTLVMQTKREQLKRLHRAQVIQRQLEEVEEKQRALEEKGVALEKVLRGESGDASADEAELLQSWFQLVLEKNKLNRYESELIIFAKELELEDRQSQLQQELRHRMTTEEREKSTAELADEQVLLDEVMKVVEERDRLVSLLEEQRLQEKAEDRDLGSLILSKGYQFHWA